MVILATIKFVIPSYNRADIITTNTLKLLEAFQIPKKQIYVFVVPEEHEIYSSSINNKDIKIINGELGLANQRNFITNYFKEGQMLVNLDDDLKEFQILENGTITKITTPIRFKDFIIRGFNLCKAYGSYLWGIHQTYNPRYMAEKISFDLSFVVGHFWGCINRHLPEINITMDIKEDYERTLKYWNKDNIIIKLNYIAAKNAIYKTKGGLQATYPSRSSASTVSCNALISSYPDLISSRKHQLNTMNVNKYDELKIIKHLSIKTFYKHLEPLNTECPLVINLIKQLELAQLPVYTKRLNTGIGITHCFGSYRIRKKKGLYDSVNNAKFPELYAAILEYASKYVPISYTGIQVNKNYKAKPHYDSRNYGESYLVGLGNYKGGRLCSNGAKIDIKNKPILFDGRIWKHWVEDFDGSRYSLVFFNQITH